MSITDFKLNGGDWNIQWSDTFDKFNWAPVYDEDEDERDIESTELFCKWCKLTCCHTTASMIAWKLGHPHMVQSFCKLEDLLKEHKFFQIKMCSKPDKPYHILTIYNNYVLQSWLRAYRLKVIPLTPEFINLFDNIPKNWTTICDVSDISDGKCTSCIMEDCLCDTQPDLSQLCASFWVPKKT